MTIRDIVYQAKKENLLVCPVVVGTRKLSFDRVCNNVLYEFLRALETNKYRQSMLTEIDKESKFNVVLNGEQASVIIDALSVYNDALDYYFEDEINAQLSDVIKAIGDDEDDD